MSDKPKSSIKPFDLKAVKYEGNLEKLARQIGVNRHDLRYLLNQQLRPGLKILGRRFGSNIDTMAGYLNEVRKKNQAKPPKSKIVRGHPQSAYPYAPITATARLKYFAKAHEIPFKVIQDAIDAVKTKGWDESRAIKQLLNTLDNEEVPSDQIRKFIEDQTRKITDPRGLRIDRLKEHVTKNTDIRWRTIQNALDMGKSPKQLLNDLKGNLGQDEHRYAEGLQKEFKKWNANRRALKSAGSKITKFQRPDLAQRANLQIKELTELGKEAKSQDLWKWKREAGFTAPNIPKSSQPLPKSSQLKIRNLASGLKGAATQLGAGIAINALADKFVKPHTDALGRRLGTSLGRWAKDFDEEQQKKNAKKKKEK